MARAAAPAPALRVERIVVPAGVLTGSASEEGAEHAAWRAGYRARLWRRWGLKLLLFAGLPVSLLAPPGTSDALLWGLRIGIVALLAYRWSKDRREAKAAGLR
ncbi:hypothetical protein BH10PSE5_BH10PSE5_08790 [soil metagenome]